MSDNAPDDYFLIVSRLEPYKKIDLAIEACNKLGRQLVIIGEGKDRNRLQALAGKTIEFLGRQSDKAVHEYMRNAYALIFPGEEDFGLTPLESMASGRPVLAYRKGGTVETVIDGTTGLFFNEPTSESLAECLNRFSDKYLSFSPSNCRKQAERFSVEQFKENIGDYVDSSYNVWIKRNG
ncbi:MAG: Glycogen synthase [bacterium ADurb.Bin400]|nr:MAG: Glycogen synthase [bacterium ADurb.Bin400]